MPDFPDAKADILFADGTHHYWSTHCRHGDHAACDAVELAPGVPRQPSQCKGCHAPCRCACHVNTVNSEGEQR